MFLDDARRARETAFEDTKDLEEIVLANERQKRLDAEKGARLETVSDINGFSHFFGVRDQKSVRSTT